MNLEQGNIKFTTNNTNSIIELNTIPINKVDILSEQLNYIITQQQSEKIEESDNIVADNTKN